MKIGSVIDVCLILVWTWFDKSLVIWFASGLHANILLGLALICMWFGKAEPHTNQKYGMAKQHANKIMTSIKKKKEKATGC